MTALTEGLDLSKSSRRRHRGDWRILLRRTFKQIQIDMRRFCRSIAAVGYNGVTLDDVPHLADHEFYEESVRERIAINREEFRRLFAIIREEGMHIYLTMDILTFTPALEEKLGTSEKMQRDFLSRCWISFFRFSRSGGSGIPHR